MTSNRLEVAGMHPMHWSTAVRWWSHRRRFQLRRSSPPFWSRRNSELRSKQNKQPTSFFPFWSEQQMKTFYVFVSFFIPSRIRHRLCVADNGQVNSSIALYKSLSNNWSHLTDSYENNWLLGKIFIVTTSCLIMIKSTAIVLEKPYGCSE